jgi:NAD(P)H-hydrate epimerase
MTLVAESLAHSTDFRMDSMDDQAGDHLFEGAEIPVVDGATMAAVDQMLVKLGFDLRQVMEAAGRAVATFARSQFLDGDPRGAHVIILCGPGGNGGDGLVAARWLHSWGAVVEVWLSHSPDPAKAISFAQFDILRRMGMAIVEPVGRPRLPDAELVIDALFGFNLHGPPIGSAAALIVAANAHTGFKLAVDLPSGLNADDGTPYDPCFRADATLTLALPKVGLLAEPAAEWVGQLALADIGIPPEAFALAGIAAPPIFAENDFIALIEDPDDAA